MAPAPAGSSLPTQPEMDVHFTHADRLDYKRHPLRTAARFLDVAVKKPSPGPNAQVANLIHVGIGGLVVASAQKDGPVLDSFTVSMPFVRWPDWTGAAVARRKGPCIWTQAQIFLAFPRLSMIGILCI